VPGRFSLRVVTPSGEVRGPYGPFTAGSDGAFDETLPAAATAGILGSPESQFIVTASVEAVNASYDDASTGDWVADRAGAASAVLRDRPSSLLVDVKYLSDVGWVKPGESYPIRVLVHNFTDAVRRDAVVRLAPVDGTTFTRVAAAKGAGSGAIESGAIVWSIGDVAAGTDDAPTTKTLVVEARADTLGQDPRIAWKDLSATARLMQAGAAAVSATSHGPKVIPPFETYETARYGDRPFPVVPVDYFDRAHESGHSGKLLADVINSPLVKGSTFNLYQEMSFGQLFPNGTVPSSSIATAGWDAKFKSPRYQQSGFVFSDLAPQGTCKGATLKDVTGTPLYSERIRDGWYQLPGTTEYYGGDQFGSGLVGAQIGNSTLQSIDSACGPTSKAVYDAAMVADPEIDYSDYDTDKDGVVDFFMMVFVGLGGNGDSQLNGTPPYDNIWPHSSSLEESWLDEETGLRGYISDDQLRDLEDRPLYYTDKSRITMTTDVTDFPVYVRVGPYNVNPEGAIENASVISHEYGHSLGLPDFYRNGGLQTYGSWTLMATDYSQHMDIFSKQELGWIVPRVLPDGETVVRDWRDSKRNTHRIDWETPDGVAYTLSGPGVNNGEAYVAKLPAKRVIDPAVVANGASAPHVWWSRSGNDFGCGPLRGHNFDISLPELAKVPAGTEIIATFKSFWEIEWDFDYGFTMLSSDGGQTYESLPSQNGFTTPAAVNPNANACQTQWGNGLTGSTGSYAAPGGIAADRVNAEYRDPEFVEDSYDLSAAAGKEAVLRFSYSTDPGLAMKGWFIDDLKITAGGKVIYESDFEQANDTHLFNGGCRDDLRVAPKCTDGWSYLTSTADSVADHAYYMEMRDRSGFEFKDGHGQSDRGDITFSPGLLVVYTDENHGYGNNGVSGAPAQSPVDSQPQPGGGGPTDGILNDFPNLDDAAFTAAEGDNTYSDSGKGYTDNYEDPESPDGLWRHAYECLSLEVLKMAGDDVGPETAPGNLVGDVRIRTGGGCGKFDHGFGVPNLPPIPILQLKPNLPRPGEAARFDANASYDDKDASSRLRFAWDFGGDGRFDASGSSVEHTFARAGNYKVVLRATDTAGASATTTQTVTVSGVLSGGHLPATGLTSWPGLLGILGLAMAGLLGRSLRTRAR
jgi:M6 family metalloprotease-like protein